MRKKGLSEVMVRAVISLYDGAKTRVRVGSVYSEEFEVKVGVHQGSVLSPLVCNSCGLHYRKCKKGCD